MTCFLLAKNECKVVGRVQITVGARDVKISSVLTFRDAFTQNNSAGISSAKAERSCTLREISAASEAQQFSYSLSLSFVSLRFYEPFWSSSHRVDAANEALFVAFTAE